MICGMLLDNGGEGKKQHLASASERQEVTHKNPAHPSNQHWNTPAWASPASDPSLGTMLVA